MIRSGIMRAQAMARDIAPSLARPDHSVAFPDLSGYLYEPGNSGVSQISQNIACPARADDREVFYRPAQ